MSRVREFIILNVCMLAFLLVMVWVRPIEPLRDYVFREPMDFSGRAFVFGNQTVSREFTAPADADTIELLYVPVGESYTGSCRVDLTAADGSLSVSWLTHRYDMKPDGLMQYRIDHGKMTNGASYTLTISAPDASEENAVMVSLFGDGPGINLYDEKINIFAICALIIVFILANVWLILKDKGVEKYALPVLILSGLIMLFILAPGSGTDESAHYYWSYRLSNQMLLKGNPNEVENRYKYDFYTIDDIAGCNANTSFIMTLNGLRGIEESEPGSFECEEYRDAVFFSHLAPALGITLGRLLNLNMIRVYTLGRIFNMLLYVFLAYVGIRLIPVNKELMLLMAMMPMCMQQCCSMSYDATLNGLVFVFVGYIYKLVYENKPFVWKQMIIPLVLLIMIAPVKYVYSVLALLLILVAKDKLRVMIPLVTVPVLALVLLNRKYFAAILFAQGTQGDPILYTAGAIMHDPARFIRACLLTLGNNVTVYVKGMIGSLMTGDFVVIPEYLVIIYLVVIILCIFSCKERILEERWQKGLVIGTSVTGAALLFLAFAITQTLYSSQTISGIQSRYFIPFLIPLVYCTGNGRIMAEINRTRLFIPIWFVETGYIISIMNQIRVNV